MWPHLRAASCLVAASLIPQIVHAASTKATIDDNNGDSVTGRKPTYSANWNYGPDCPGCYVQPEQQLTFDHSWHDVTASPIDDNARNVSLSFNGTAITVYGIVPPVVTYATTYVNASFWLDGHHVGTYEHDPSKSSSTAFLYNVTVYQSTSLAYAEHNLVIVAGRDVNASYFAFDWAEYTYDPDHPTTSTSTATSSTPSGVVTSIAASSASSHSSVGPIVGGVVGGIGAVVLALLFFLLWRRRGRGKAGDRIRHVAAEELRREEIEPMRKPESDLEEGVAEMRTPDFTSATPFSAALTSSAVSSLPVESDASRRGGSVAAIVFASNATSSTADSPRTMPSSGRQSKSAMQRAELSRQMRDMEDQVAELRRRQSARPLPSTHVASPSTSSMPSQQAHSELRQQIESLQLEVDRLRAVGVMDEPPPAYEWADLEERV